MTNVQSKFLTPVFCTCEEFFHPWTDKCVNNTAGLLAVSTPTCLRIYAAVYLAGLLMRGRIPNSNDIKKTVLDIIQSAAFLQTNAYTFGIYCCLLRNLLGAFYFLTVGFAPAFLASFTAIVVERPARRPMLAFYVANVATETLWNMAENRGIVRSIPYGQTLIFGIGISVLLYLYRLGFHTNQCKDSIFNIMKIIVGKDEAGPMDRTSDRVETTDLVNRSRVAFSVWSISGVVTYYERLIGRLKSKHKSCPHTGSCISYSFYGGLKPFIGGVGAQLLLKLLFNIRNIVRMKFDWRKNIFNSNTLNLGMLVGGFPFLYKSVSCIFRHGFGHDDPRFAIPAGLLASIAFVKYPNNTVALYVLWKMIQLIYGLGIDNGILPRVPGFILILYSFCTAVLFHAGILEATAMRSSYFKFLENLSGGRLSRFNVEAFDAFGTKTSQQMEEVKHKLHIVHINDGPTCAFAF